MTADRAAKSKLTSYAIYRVAAVPVSDNVQAPLWTSAGNIDAHGAQDAIRRWANEQGDDFAGGSIMAVPSRSVTVAQVKVETRRQLTLGTP